ncbi:MAG: exonuclease domain-containing protein [Actinomycetota bacterium]
MMSGAARPSWTGHEASAQGPNSPSARAYTDAPLPPPSTPWREATFSVIDLETTGLDPTDDEIISYATVTVADGRVSLADARYQPISPRHMPGGETIRIHGLRESDLADAPPLSEALDGLLEAITGRALVAHVAVVETAFLTEALASRGLELRNPIVDTAALALGFRRRRGQPPPLREPIGLSELARALGLPVHRPHHADGDALTTAQVFLALATHLDAFEPQTVGSMQRLGSRAQRRPLLRGALRRIEARLRQS